MQLISHLRRVALVLCVLLLIVFMPSLAFGAEVTSVDLTRFVDLAKAHAWPLVAAVVVGFLVRLVKEERVPLNVPPRYRPLLAVGLGMVSAICEATLAGTDLLTAAIGGLGSSILAIGGHDVIVEAILGGKEPSVKAGSGVLGGILVALVAITQAGCGGMSKAEIEKSLNATATYIEISKPCVVKMQDQAEADCAGDAACIARVQETFEPAALGLEAFGTLWCFVSPKSEGCDNG